MRITSCLFISFLFVCSLVNAQKEVTIGNEKLTVKVNSFGAELQSIKSNNPEIEYLWQGDPTHWEGRAPVMFPVCVKFKDQRYTFKGKEYHMPDMGLAKISTFKVAEKQPDKVVLELHSNKKTLKKYPFPFILKVIYEVKENKLINKFEVENTGKETMYFALGGHPGFRFPFESERGKNQYTFSEKLMLERTEIAGGLVQENNIPWLKSENGLPLGDSRIPNAGMFVKNMPSRKIGVGVVGQTAFIEIDLGDFPNSNLWSPPGMPFACIEPMAGHHDLANSPLAIEDKNYLIKLKTGEKRSFTFSILIMDFSN